LFVFLAISWAQSCSYLATDGSLYDLSRLKLDSGGYNIVDDEGNDWYFNVCGPLVDVPYCPNDAVVCMVANGATRGVNAGRNAVWGDYVADRHSGIEVTVGAGDQCNNSSRKTTFEFLCVEDGDELLEETKLFVRQISLEDECYVVITVWTRIACPVQQSENQQLSQNEDVITALHSMVIVFFALSCCLCLSAMKSTRKKITELQTKEQMPDFAFYDVPEEPVIIQIVKPQPSAPPMPSTDSMSYFTQQVNIPPPRYVQAPPYFLYPSVQQPFQSDAERQNLL